MKTFKSIAVLAMMLLVLAGCGGSGKENTIAVQSKSPAVTKSQTPVKSQTPGDQPPEDIMPETQNTDESLPDGSDLTETQVKVGDVTIYLGEDMANYIDVFGDPIGLSTYPSSRYEGAEKYYDFHNVNIGTYPLGDKDYVSRITIDNKKPEIVCGLKVGDTVDDIKAAFDNSILQDTGTSYIYDTDTWGIQFYLTDDVIDYIEIYFVLSYTFTK